MEMYVWEVSIEGEYRTNYLVEDVVVKQGEDTWEDTISYTVASSSGLGAIDKAKELFMSQESWKSDIEDEDGNTLDVINVPNKVIDVISLALKETLDG